MKLSNCWVAVVIVFAAISAIEFLIHGVVLRADYEAMRQAFRSKEEMCKYMWLIYVGYAIMAAGLVWIYDRGKQNKPYVGQGVRFGLAVAAVACVPTTLIYYCIQPISCRLACKQLALGVAEAVVVGILIACLRKDAVAKA